MSIDSDRLAALAADIADGRSVDWDAELSTERNDSEVSLIRSLRLLADVSDAYRGLTLDATGEPEATMQPLYGERAVDLVSGQMVSHYRIVEKIGEGGMGHVFLADDTRLGRKVALKFLAEPVRDDRRARIRFVREARATAALDHPFICKVYEAGEHQGEAFIAMEYVRGQTLAERLQRGPLTQVEVLRVGEEIAEALEEAHRNRIVHRDLKPANVMLARDGHVKVMDFGLAQLLPVVDDAERTEACTIEADLTGNGGLVGTVPYMSPEQARGGEVDARSDIFSFGTMLYELLTGVHPFRKRSPAETVDAILNASPPPLARHVEDVPELLQHTVGKMLAKRPDQRYQSVHEVRTNLGCLRTRGATAEESVVAPARGSRSRWWIGLGAAAMLLAVVMAWVSGVFRPEPMASGTHGPQAARPPRIVVLPFANLGGQAENEALGDGLTDSLITRLVKIRALQVISRTSSMKFKDTELSVPEIAGVLEVDYILEGSLLKSGERYQITAQLIRAADDSHLWADEYRLPWSDIFTIQEQVLRKVVENVSAVLDLREEEALAETPTDDPAAYEAFLKGRHIAGQYEKLHDPDRFADAETLLRRALDLDPDFADAYVALARLYDERSKLRSRRERRVWSGKARRMYERAHELHPQHSGALAGLSLLGNPERALELALKAVEFAPNDAGAHRALGGFYNFRGFAESALLEFEEAVRLDPLRPDLYKNVAQVLRQLGRSAEAVERLREANRLEPHSLSQETLAETLIYMGDLDEAEEALAAFEDLGDPAGDAHVEIHGATIAALRGDRATALAVVENYRGHEWPTSIAFAVLCAVVGESALAVDHLEMTFELVGRGGLAYRICLRPVLAGLHGEPRFQAIVRAAYEEWQADLALYGPELPVPPAPLPTPDELLGQ